MPLVLPLILHADTPRDILPGGDITLLAKLIDKEKQLENFDKDNTILSIMDDLETEIEKQQEYRDTIITCKVRANKILNKTETESRNTPNTNSRREQQFSSLKLPQL
ncbi:hypothetical protein TNCV_4322081 [Trichonephila clavipes]|uniref:Uncharacterized protein n=1 Tax=Trichonephila clavipes TaxID=2585209 RepID=A0A8X6VEC8_TRICX|nr:hypothetical protein TNCV_4322081 [Trichonephila clavipes]